MSTRIGRVRGVVVAAVFVVVAAWLPTAGATITGTGGVAAAAPAVLDVPVSFTVTNINRSGVPCPTDGKQYTVRGHLTGPASQLSPTSRPNGALYLHGLEVGEWFWRMPAVGAGYAHTMAELGHVSVTIDRIGYGASDHPPGFGSCIGGQADIAHQIVQQLREGSYAGEIHPRFGRIALTGHSLGGAVTQIAAYSFRDVDAIAVLSYADAALSFSSIVGSVNWGLRCATGGTPSQDAPGYAYLTSDVADYQKNFLAHTPPAALPEATAARQLNPCGDMLSLLLAAPINLARIGQINVPVLVMSGNQDLVFDANRVELQANLFAGSSAVTVHTVEGATHGITVEPTVGGIVAEMDTWLDQNGF
ncbi:alpha/beta hydrolase [Nocardia cyriacigeorgica]|uniref:alpha/beta hydrolase n=1 Tax=Nocardia cyriacigeorgica TaxID=135487 RepID=UPI0013BD23E3|nr:alpha/beta hydrolase [Nocardia cyriacigeorgica]NEW51818.1 alpha/beta hydrolase [Nocardia cyriacigeorgica]